MKIDPQHLIEWYCRERYKFEGLAASKREMQIAFCGIKYRVLEALSRELDMSSLKTIYEDELHLKEFFESPIAAVSINEAIEKLIADERKTIEQEKASVEKNHRDDTHNQEQAEYFFQLAKVKKIEVVLKKEIPDCHPDKIFKEYKSKNNLT